jgi:asparagine synthase (glutamine-hydrolysing)
MCGIAGIASFRNSPPPHFGQVKAMCDVLVHRGPDEEGIDVRDGVALGMRRLSVIDLAGGKQPIYNEDGTIRIVFNGEIYNYRELRKELQTSVMCSDNSTRRRSSMRMKRTGTISE